MKPWLALFLAGYLTCTALRSLQQDLLGKEKYIAMCDAAWVDGGITIPLALLMLVAAWWMVKVARRDLGDAS